MTNIGIIISEKHPEEKIPQEENPQEKIKKILNDVIDEVIVETEVTNKIIKRDKNQSKIWKYEKEISRLKNENRTLEKQISNECNHIWVRELERGMYEKSWKQCTKCNLYNMYY